MTTKDISGFLFAGLCIAIILTAGMLANGTAQSYYYPSSNIALQTPQEREELFKAFQSAEKNTSQATVLANPYNALQNPYAYTGPQAALEQANANKMIQKLNGIYQIPVGDDSWYYWTNMWLNSPLEAANSGASFSTANPYNALQNPYAYTGPQAALEQANANKMIQKLNGIYQIPVGDDSWYYWTNMWLNNP